MSGVIRQTRTVFPLLRTSFTGRLASDYASKSFLRIISTSRCVCCGGSRLNQRYMYRESGFPKMSPISPYCTTSSKYSDVKQGTKIPLTNKGFRESIVNFATHLNVNIPEDKDLLAAFTHESYLIVNADRLSGPFNCNEKLAFLGAQTARKCFTEYLYHNFPELSALENWDVQNALLEDFIMQKAVEWDIQPKTLYYRQPKELMLRQTVLALVGAVYNHESPEKADTFVKKHLIPELTKDKIEDMVKLQHPKFIIQSISDMKGHFPLKTKLDFQEKNKSKYHVNNPLIYSVTVTRGEKSEVLGQAVCHSLVLAEKKACQKALIDHYPDEFNKFQLVLNGDEFVKEENVDLGLIVAEQRVVQLEKQEDESFGFRIRGGEMKKKQTEKFIEFHYMSPVYISHIIPGSVAAKCGGLHVGDKILAVNDRSVEGLDHERVVKLLKSVSALIADQIEMKFKEIKRQKRLAELSSDAWSEWHQAQSNQTPSQYKDVLKYHNDSSS